MAQFWLKFKRYRVLKKVVLEMVKL